LSLESTIQERLRVHGLVPDRETVLEVLEILRLEEAKSIGSRKKTKPRAKDAQVSQIQQNARFRSSQRGHARNAAKELEKEVASLRIALMQEISKYQEGDISYRRLKTVTALQIKGAAAKAFQLGAKSVGFVTATGALQSLTPDEQSWVDSYVREELKNFDKVLRGVVTGDSDRRIEYRANAYAVALKSVYESGRVLSSGIENLIYWDLESDHPCVDCKLLHRHSPFTAQSLPTTPKGGATRCHHNCKCSLRIVQPSSSQVYKAAASKQKAPAWYLRRLKK
jgi:hypothetical protein